MKDAVVPPGLSAGEGAGGERTNESAGGSTAMSVRTRRTHTGRTAPCARKRGRRGATIVEFVLLSSFLFTIIFGIVEFGMIMNDQLALINASRHACRQGVAGKTATEMRDAVRAMSKLNVTDPQILIDCNDQPDCSGTWTDVYDDGTGLSNTAARGEPLRVRVNQWPHRMLAGSMFSWVTGVTAGTLRLSSSVTLRRE